MTLIKQTSPHTISANRTQLIMKLVLLSAIPGVLAQTIFFGWGAIINILWCSMLAIGCEALVLKLRKRSIKFHLNDYSVIVTALLFAISLPPLAPWWLTLAGIIFAVIVGKHLYGGLGQNPFNPAMLGYVLLLISFPQEMTSWLSPLGITGSIASQPLDEGVLSAFTSIFWEKSVDIDAVSMATPLDVVRWNNSLTMDELWSSNPIFQNFAGRGWFWINIYYLLGGLFLLYKKVFTWHGPFGMLIALTVMSFLFLNGDGSESHGSTLFHLFSGASMLGAFFIVTDPVSSATSNRGRLIFGAGVGIFVYIIRAWGGYPDGVAFAILLMNMASPTIDYYTQPRTYGHKKPNKGLPTKSE
ncbi:MAG: electron transport complex subunit RsxD [Candidatus Endonucleobacter bathymodioli]|uniref:Ion-translocating oxidoreductase complex subunit D n=1 Tax=Candidatus Endonucleibacter bathymodioli TaxID=539814 RepID=A0AA90STV1_9GAMM|nr:electron transport complex subunit RsxD [Candidatus Endonucleobacter bathymodioli]